MLQFVIELLDDNHGISVRAFNTLQDVVEMSDDIEEIEELFDKTVEYKGRIYLPTNWKNK